MDMKLGGWGQLLPTILKVTSRSSGVIQSQIEKYWFMDMKLGGWGLESIVDAENVEGHQGHPRSNDVK